ncbi:uncharacterized protein Dwil_GK27583 [Drosophila willistoni]|uniref:BPTI/Kunitz inhibitor domain-containing protein n=2 Tax=Drosophila willistoni TaxID=7260 RepID=A0A0Q9WQR6_DROWI|nr:uncharacterized protein Dwil_GK27583 [Drosophila willistoni]
MKFFTIICLVCALFGLTYAAKDAICDQPAGADGNGLIKCAAFMPSWTYNPASNSCSSFVYGGCGGNSNRFTTQEACEAKCKE